jgi:hypothetical protein
MPNLEDLKEQARDAAKHHEWSRLTALYKRIDQLSDEIEAALAFYNELDQLCAEADVKERTGIHD